MMLLSAALRLSVSAEEVVAVFDVEAILVSGEKISGAAGCRLSRQI